MNIAHCNFSLFKIIFSGEIVTKINKMKVPEHHMKHLDKVISVS